MKKPNRVLMVCLGNICRSPMAEGIMRSKATQFKIELDVDSAGTGGWHEGERPDARARACMQNHGLNIEYLKARQFKVADFDRFDILFAMDESNYQNLMTKARHAEDKAKIKLMLDYLGNSKLKAVPDPYYGGAQEFEDVYKMLDLACENFCQSIIDLEK